MSQLQQIVRECVRINGIDRDCYRLIHEKAQEGGISPVEMFSQIDSTLASIGHELVIPQADLVAAVDRYVENGQVSENEYTMLRKMANLQELNDRSLANLIAARMQIEKVEEEPVPEGVNLRSLIGPIGIEDRKRRFQLFTKLVHKVKDLHIQSKVHGGLCPELIFLDEQDEVHIQAYHPDSGLNIKAYVPGDLEKPEVEGETEAFDPREDLYALGIIYLELLTGLVKYSTSLDLKSEQHEIILRCILKADDKRYPGIDPLIEKLKKLDQPEIIEEVLPSKPALPTASGDRDFKAALEADTMLDLHKLNIPLPHYPKHIEEEVMRLRSLIQFPILSSEEKHQIFSRIDALFESLEKTAYHYTEHRLTFIKLWNELYEARGKEYIDGRYFSKPQIIAKYN